MFHPVALGSPTSRVGLKAAPRRNEVHACGHNRSPDYVDDIRPPTCWILIILINCAACKRQGAETELEQLVEEFKRLALSASLKESQLAASQIMAVVAELGGRAPADGTLALLNGDHESSWLYSKRRLALLNFAMPRDCPAT